MRIYASWSGRYGYVQNQSSHSEVFGVIALQAKYRLQFMEEEIKKAEEQLVIPAGLDSTDGGKQDRGEWSMNSLCVYGNSWSSIKQTIAIRAHTKSTFRIDSHWIWFTEISQDPPTTVGKQHIKTMDSCRFSTNPLRFIAGARMACESRRPSLMIRERPDRAELTCSRKKCCCAAGMQPY